jgi:hypothetical protein
MDPGEAMPAGIRDAYCHEGGTVLEPWKDGRSVTVTGEPAFGYGGAYTINDGMACAPAEVDEARR